MTQRLSMMIKRGMLLALMFIALLPSALMAKGAGNAVIMQNAIPQYGDSGFLTITDTLRILFPVNVDYVDVTFSDNANSINRLQDWIEVCRGSDWNLEKIVVVGSCRPDGKTIALCKEASTARMETLIDYFRGNIPGFDYLNVRATSLGRDWEGLLKLVEKDPSVPFRDEVISMLNGFIDEGEDKEGNLKKMKTLRYGIPYEHMKVVILDQLRVGYIYLTVNIPASSINGDMTRRMRELLRNKVGDEYFYGFAGPAPEPEPVPEPATESEPQPELVSVFESVSEPETVSVVESETVSVVEPEPVYEPVSEPEPVVEPAPVTNFEPNPAFANRTQSTEKGYKSNHKKQFCMNLQTNMLYDAVLQPNVGFEFHLGSGWSLGADWKFAWWKNGPKDWVWKTYGGDLYLRKWLGAKAKEKPLTGHHIGLVGQMLTYQYQIGSKGVMADQDNWIWGASFEYGYSLPVARRLNIDFDIAVGYMGGTYYDIEDVYGELVWTARNSKQYIGPTKVAVSFIWQIGRGNVNKSKSKHKRARGRL